MTPDAQRATRTADAVMRDVSSIERALRTTLGLRVALQATGAGVASWMLLQLLLSAALPLRMRDVLSPTVLFALPLMASVAVVVLCAVMLWRNVGVISPVRTALWIEEHGGTDFALVTWVEQQQAGGASEPAGTLAERVGAASAGAMHASRQALGLLAKRAVLGPVLFLVGAIAVLVAQSAVTGSSQRRSAADRDTSVPVSGPRAAVPFSAWRVRIVPPAYTKRSSVELADTNAVRALSGSRIEIVGRDATPDSVVGRALSVGESDSAARRPLVTLAAQGSGWRAAVTATDGPLEVRALRDRFAKLLLVEGIVDSVPQLLLIAPARDSVLRTVTAPLELEATVHDDLGLVNAEFEIVISSGEGEQFTVRTMRMGARTFAGERNAQLRSVLDLAALALGPGDVVHMRAVARDANPQQRRGVGASDTRSIRIARPSEYDSVAVEPAPPPDVDKSLLSQRMLLMLTERLDARRARVDAVVLRSESRKLAIDQSRLRQAVGDAVFQRLTGEQGGEHAHSVGDGHDHGVEAIGGKLALSGVNAQGMLEEGDDAPVVAINTPLLEAYNAMWDAGRALEQADTRSAIPFMRRALEAIERARAASRLYLRGRPPTVIVDIAKVRLAGKDTSAPVEREVRSALPTTSAGRERRLLAAASLAVTDARAARDSLAVLRAESLADAPMFAAALTGVLESLTTARDGTDVTAPFVRARRVLGGIQRIPSSTWSRGGGAVSSAGDDSHPLAADARKASAPFVFATAQYDSGDWDSAPMVPANVIDAVARYTSLEVAPQGVVVPLSSEACFQYPLLFLTGHLPVRFTAREVDVVRRYLRRGGLLFVDDHNHDVDGAFHKTVREEIARVAGALVALPKTHPLYRAFFVFDNGPPTTSHEMNGWGDNLVHEHLDAVLFGTRIAVLYSNKDYSSEWSYHPDNKRFLSVDNTKFAVNLVVYALTR